MLMRNKTQHTKFSLYPALHFISFFVTHVLLHCLSLPQELYRSGYMTKSTVCSYRTEWLSSYRYRCFVHTGLRSYIMMCNGSKADLFSNTNTVSFHLAPQDLYLFVLLYVSIETVEP
jgi:hypothetical protein